MIFTETILAGAYLIEFERFEDARGFFARSRSIRFTSVCISPGA